MKFTIKIKASSWHVQSMFVTYTIIQFIQVDRHCYT